MADLPQLGSTLLALLFVVALIAVLAVLARRFGLARSLVPLGQARRLAVVEALALDGKHRLVLVRRDGVEHLILLGPATDSVIETQIARRAAPSQGIER